MSDILAIKDKINQDKFLLLWSLYSREEIKNKETYKHIAYL